MYRGGGRARGREAVGGAVSLKAFFGAAFTSALELGIAAPDDLLRHVTPDVLAAHLPRPLWARLLAACLGAPRVDAQLVIETLGIPNLCEHIPAGILWSCIEELAVRALGGVVAVPASASPARPVPLTPPPPPEPRTTPAAPVAVGPSIPPPGLAGEADADSARVRTSSPRFRPTSTGIGRLAANTARRPLAHATPPTPPPPVEPPVVGTAAPLRPRRSQTDSDFDLETHVGGKDDWKNALAVEEEQLVDWSAADETATGNDSAGRKR